MNDTNFETLHNPLHYLQVNNAMRLVQIKLAQLIVCTGCE